MAQDNRKTLKRPTGRKVTTKRTRKPTQAKVSKKVITKKNSRVVSKKGVVSKKNSKLASNKKASLTKKSAEKVVAKKKVVFITAAKAAGKKKTADVAIKRRVPIQFAGSSTYEKKRKEIEEFFNGKRVTRGNDAAKKAKLEDLKYANRGEEYQTVEWRNAIADALINGDIKIPQCDLPKLIHEPIYKIGAEKGSVSESMVVFGKLNFTFVNKPDNELLSYSNQNEYRKKVVENAQRDVVIKISFIPYDTQDNALEVEAEIYEKLIANLAWWGYTPNVMLPYAVYKCLDFKNRVRAITDYKLRERIESYMRELSVKSKNGYNLNQVQVLILERGHGKSLDEWCKEYHTPNEWFSIIFQVLYTLECFNQIDMRHNDLHMGNIWIETPIKPQYFVYFINERDYFVIPITSMAKIYDFDRGTCWNPKNMIFNNTIKKWFCKSIGQCNDPNYKYDTYKFMHGLYVHAPDYIKKWLAPFFHGSYQFLNKKWGWSGLTCKLVAPGKCDGDYEAKDSEMIPTLKMLEIGFASYKRSLPAYDPKYLPENGFVGTYMLPEVHQNHQAHIDRILDKKHITPIDFSKIPFQ
jgi:hypothetical protein